jgi:hypothetical protein
MTTALEGGRGQRHAPAALYPGKDPVPIVQEAPRAGLDKCGKSRPSPGFDPRTVQPVASRYTDSATRPTYHGVSIFKKAEKSENIIFIQFIHVC